MKTIKLLLIAAMAASMLLPPIAYADEGGAAVRFEVEKRLEGAVPAVEEDYVFVLESEGGAPLPDETRLTITGEGTASFPEITYDELETYRYTVRELAGDSKSCSYDPSVYEVTVQVTTDEEGQLEATVYASRQGSDAKAGSLLFVNSYEADDAEGDDFFSRFFPTTGDDTYMILVSLAAFALIALLMLLVARSRARRS